MMGLRVGSIFPAFFIVWTLVLSGCQTRELENFVKSIGDSANITKNDIIKPTDEKNPQVQADLTGRARELNERKAKSLEDALAKTNAIRWPAQRPFGRPSAKPYKPPKTPSLII